MMATVVGFLTEVSLEVVRSRDDEAEAVIDEAMSLLASLLTTFVHIRDDRPHQDTVAGLPAKARRTTGGGSASR
jgi:hypothetical protein